MEIGKIIREARIEKGMTQEELGKIVGLQKSAIAKYENGRVVNIKRSTLQKLAKALDLKGSDLIIESDPVAKPEITFDDFTYAFYNESKNLSEEQKAALLNMAKLFNEQLNKEE